MCAKCSKDYSHTKHLVPMKLAPESTVRLFAHDTISYLTVTSASDTRTLQQDLHKLGDWEKKWHMEFHPAKCQVLTVARKRNPIHYEYKLHGHILEHVTSAKYLGVTSTSDMIWGQHVNNITVTYTVGIPSPNLDSFRAHLSKGLQTV